MKIVEFFLGLMAFIAITVLGVGVDKISFFIDLSSVLCVGGALIAYYIAGPGFSKSVNAYVCLIKKTGSADKSAEIFHYSAIISLIAGIYYTLIDCFNMLVTGFDSVACERTGFASVITTVFYGTGLAIFFFICKTKVLVKECAEK